ncbi:MAG: class I SAM-dependent methyltransferase [Desulfovibrio sp.]|jgi:SAM-dependent methyltransferase|nr:class I SAM-dependent methyltransferase [Desulfovibrio sp.]
MGLIAPREPEAFHFSSPREAVSVIDYLRPLGGIRLFDAIAEAVASFPGLEIPLLALACQLYAAQEDRSRYALYQARIFDFPITSGNRVLDLGSGHAPFPLATHLADIDLGSGQIGRAGVAFRHVRGKPVFRCSVEKTPFADKEFDFVYCSHVLEHAQDPAAACAELMRIARRGYIETPTRGKDVFLRSAQISNHKNYCELFHGVLTFRHYEAWEMDGIGFDILQKMHTSPETEREKAFSALLYLYPRAVNVMLLWEDGFEFLVEY